MKIILFSYQYGPDTYLLQLRDTDFPVRLREYLKVANRRSPAFAYENVVDWSVCSTTKYVNFLKQIIKKKIFTFHSYPLYVNVVVSPM